MPPRAPPSSMNFRLLPVLGLMLTGCSLTPATITAPPMLLPPSTPTRTDTSGTNALLCSEVQIVQLSRFDTDQTKLQVEANNHVIATLCPATK